MTSPKNRPSPDPAETHPSAAQTPPSEGPPSTNALSPAVWPKGEAPSPVPAGGSDTWPPEKVVAGRYRIVRFLGRGGMGDVYEAEDLDLRGHVALKTVRLDVAADPQLAERFRREIQLARKVTHPNICRIYDVGYDRPATPEGEGATQVRFLTMELLPGQTLSSRISKSGRFSGADALPIVEQMAAGLDAIHALGIIHRDFKSGNVILVPSSDSRRPVRAVVTDFGLARAGSTTESLMSLSDGGKVVGTPAYMAPEQVEGKELSPAADVYALGVVMYEMVTGIRPFDGGSAITVAVRRLKEAPAPPRQHVPDLDPLWESTILRCLARDPSSRFDRAGDVVRALSGATVGPTKAAVSGEATASVVVPSGERARPGRRAWLYAAGAAGLIVAALGGYLWQLQRPAAGSSAPDPQAAGAAVTLRRSVAVLGFKNVSGRKDADWLSTVASEMAASVLGAGGTLRVVPGHEVARVKTDLNLEHAASYSKDDLARIQQNLAADLVVAGSYSMEELGDRMLRIEVRLQDAGTGETLLPASATGSAAQLFDVVSRAAAPLRKRLGLVPLAAAHAIEIQSAFPANPEAARAYADGVSKLRLFDAQGAQAELERAIALEPKHPLPHVALSAAYSALGYEARAAEEAESAAGLAAGLPREQRLAIDARFHETKKDWAKAAETHRSLFGDHPDSLDHGLRLVEAQIAARKTKEALVTLEQLRKLPAPLSVDPRIDLAEASVYNVLGEPRRYLAAAVAAATKGTAQGARLLVARARLFEATALLNQGKPKEALKPVEEARTLYEAVGDRSGLARSLERMALALRAAGDLDGAKRIFDRALAIHRDVGDEASAARVLHNTGTVLLAQGKLDQAQSLEDEALATFQRAGAKIEAAAALNDMGSRLQRAGDLIAAAKRYEQALSLSGETGERRGIAIPLSNLAEVLFLRGDLKRSQEMTEEALAIERETGRKAGIAYKLFRLGEIFRARGDWGVAAERYAQALAVYMEIGDKTGAADVQTGQAALGLEQKRSDEAEALARQAEETLRGARANDRAASAQVVLAGALLARGKLDEARKLEKGALWAKSQDRSVRVSGAIMAARLRAASGKAADVTAAGQSLAATTAECAKAGLVQCQLEARLAAGQLERAAGRTTAGARLKALASEAESKGFGSLARRAAEAAAR